MHQRRLSLILVLGLGLLGAVAFLSSRRNEGHRTRFESVHALPGIDDQVITLLHYFESGRQIVDSHMKKLATSGKLSQDLLQRMHKACVRVEVVFAERDGHSQRVLASGVVVRGKYVLTAGHSVRQHENCRFEVIARDGTLHKARLVQWEYEVYETRNRDWAILELDAGHGLPSVEIAKAQAEDLAIILGFPDGIGIDADGHIAQGKSSKKRAPLDALTTLGLVQQESPIVMKPLAGCIPLGGLSGGPVYNDRGEVFGIFVSAVKTIQKEALLYSYHAVAIDDVGPLLDKLEGR